MVSGQSGKKSYPHGPLFSPNVARHFKNQGRKLPVMVILEGRATSKKVESDFYRMQSVHITERNTSVKEGTR